MKWIFTDFQIKTHEFQSHSSILSDSKAEAWQIIAWPKIASKKNEKVNIILGNVWQRKSILLAVMIYS